VRNVEAAHEHLVDGTRRASSGVQRCTASPISMCRPTSRQMSSKSGANRSIRPPNFWIL